MRKFIQQKLKEQKGLTLIELLAVIVILAIIAAIAIPAIANIIENSRVGAIKSDATNILNAAELYKADTAEIVDPEAVKLQDLIDNNLIEDLGSFVGTEATTTINITDMEISGTAILNDNIEVVFTGASKAEIAGVPNGSESGEAGVVDIDRDYVPTP